MSDSVRVQMLQRVLDEVGTPSAYWQVRVVEEAHPDRSVESLLEEAGEMPLPPYIERDPGGQVQDRSHYQTIFAREPGAVAAPTAGLHFTPGLLDELRNAGVQTAEVTLHVGLGTFLPMPEGDPDLHKMHEERFEVGPELVQAVHDCRARGGRVIAVGTTSARALEAASQSGELRASSGRTDLFIRPGYTFQSVDGLLTNFHLPGSTLLLLVGALLGSDRLLEIYREAIDKRWRFYSYGDAMLILPPGS